MTVELSEDDIRMLICALNIYKKNWIDMQSRLKRRKNAVDMFNATGTVSVEWYDSEIEVAKSRLVGLHDLTYRLASTIRETEN